MRNRKDILAWLCESLKRAAALAAALGLALSNASPSWAQRRSAEPEANPQFQKELQSPENSPAGTPFTTAPPEEEAAPASASSALESVQIGTSPAPKPSGQEKVSPLDIRVSVRVKSAPLATFLDTIAAQARVNFIITEGLETKRVTAFLQNVTVREALQVLLEIKGLTYQQIGKSNTYVVTPRSKTVENLVTRIYTLSYVPLIPLATPASDQSASGAAAAAASSSSSGSEVAIVSVLKSVLSKSGQVAMEPRTNSLIVTDIPEVFPQVEQIIAELDKKAPQVIIEAQIVMINSTRSKDLGIEWGGPNGELGSFTAGQRDTSFPMQLPGNFSKLRFLDPVSNVVTTVGSASGNTALLAASNSALFTGGLKTSLIDLTQLKVTLRALVSRSEARFLGKPKVLTLNNKAAFIETTSREGVSVQQSQSSGGSLTQSSITVERFDTGLKLTVTPQINKDGYITMLVQPSFTDVEEAVISSAAQRVFNPVVRKASTLVRVKNGQTLVLGGLLESREIKTVRKVPFLGYIPLIGWLFTSTHAQRRNEDLVVFLTPTIVND
ncbi:MAG: hypothetical protein HY921_01125 [Elusimicrobia bacterium]|nr:hypothetical protein [Elusimicrobiota bacterium]